MEPKLGEKYKINGSNAKGWWTLVEVRDGKHGPELLFRQDQKTRFFTKDQIIMSANKSKRQVIISDGCENFGALKDGTGITLEQVSHWPNWGERGRPRVNR